jgi:hypothetical protein
MDATDATDVAVSTVRVDDEREPTHDESALTPPAADAAPAAPGHENKVAAETTAVVVTPHTHVLHVPDDPAKVREHASALQNSLTGETRLLLFLIDNRDSR